MKQGGNMVRIVRALLAFFAVSLLFSSPANAWWNNDWKYRKAVTVDTSPTGVNIAGPVGRSVVLVRLTSGNFSFDQALKNGADIRLVDSDDKTPLKFHIENYDQQTGIASLWVEVAALNGGEKKKLWLYFGNDKSAAGDDVKGTFDPDYLLVYHFAGAAGQPANDATANANNSANPLLSVNDGSVVGRGARFAGVGQLLVNDGPTLAMPAGSQFSFSTWIKPADINGDAAVFSRGGFVIGAANGVPYVMIGGSRIDGKAALKAGAWNHIAVVADGQTVKLYLDGVETAAASVAFPAMAGAITIGGADGRPFNGELDEVRLSKVARLPSMFLAAAAGEGPGGKLVVVDETAEQQGAGGGVLYFIFSKLEPVDAVIIGLCMILLAMAITLIVQKIRYLNAAKKGNDQFFKRFSAMHEELVPLADVDGISTQEVAYIKKASPLARIYEMGIEELDVRRKNGALRPLSGEAVEAMRAAVDAVYVEENQKLDSMMVILTIAISGGPFIGLLGTVVGVMTVFGGVAMAGDVNVNAIAPGIAAALLATIAGLACAIPALFGYNYLNGRISALADQMRVFIDRLITRLAEMQADAAYARQAAE